MAAGLWYGIVVVKKKLSASHLRAKVTWVNKDFYHKRLVVGLFMGNVR